MVYKVTDESELRIAVDTIKAGDTILLSGTITLTDTLHIRGKSQIKLSGDNAILTGKNRIYTKFTPFHDGIYMARVDGVNSISRVYVDGREAICARYPNYSDDARFFNGSTSHDELMSRAVGYASPRGGRIHGMHKALWGDYHYAIEGRDENGGLILSGGHQNNRPGVMNQNIQYVDNIFEELDSPREWYFNAEQGILYYMPEPGQAIDDSTVEIVPTDLTRLIDIQDCRDVKIEGITLSGTAYTYMSQMEPLLRSDWKIARDGTIFVENCEDIIFSYLELDSVGGNGIFVSGRNERVECIGCDIHNAGASGICFVGRSSAVRMKKYNYDQLYNSIDNIDLTPGPESDEYPRDCKVKGCLIALCGRQEKQSAGVQISMAARITVEHCTIHNLPRAGINIGDGCFGGHVIAHNDVFNTVLETSDHGAFNSWGRDRFWNPDIHKTDDWVKEKPELPTLDALETTLICDNRMQCAFGWDIDLDDGSTNYEICRNLCLGGGIKNREGYFRYVHDNIMTDTFHPHVWYKQSHDRFVRNIVMSPYKPIACEWFGDEIDYNFLHIADKAVEPASELQAITGVDSHSMCGDAGITCEYQLSVDSPAAALGITPLNVDDSNYGITDEKLKAKAKLRGGIHAGLTPFTAYLLVDKSEQLKPDDREWFGEVCVKTMNTLGELSATGLDRIHGVLVLHGDGILNMRDVILAVDGASVDNVADFKRQLHEGSKHSLTIWRNQSEIEVIR